jgi:hypothetical protein
MLRKILYFSFLMGLFNTSVQAELQETIYTGIQAAQFTYEDDSTGIEGEPPALVLRIGGYLDGGTAIEFRFGFGLNGYDDTVNVPGLGDVDFEVENLLGLYGLYHIGWGSNASLYGLLGVTNGKIKVTGPGFKFDDRETNLSYGIGLNIARLNFEYVHYFHDNDFDVTAISIGFVSKF